MVTPSDIRTYKEYVRLLCNYSAQLDRFTRILNAGGYVSVKLISYTLSKIKDYRLYTLQAMNQMGIEDGLLFMEDNEFLGFKIKNGTLVLDEEMERVRVAEVCNKWIRDYPENANWYQYGVAMFCICLAYQDKADLESLYPAWLLEWDRQCREEFSIKPVPVKKAA